MSCHPTRRTWAAVEHEAAVAVLHQLTQLTWLDLRHPRMQASALLSFTVLRKLEVSARRLCDERGIEAREGGQLSKPLFLSIC
jgi:hypothetical protein